MKTALEQLREYYDGHDSDSIWTWSVVDRIDEKMEEEREIYINLIEQAQEYGYNMTSDAIFKKMFPDHPTNIE
jgi:hypothetical protein